MREVLATMLRHVQDVIAASDNRCIVCTRCVLVVLEVCIVCVKAKMAAF